MKNDVAVELYYSGAWHDITDTDDVYTRDPITISRDARPGSAQSIASLSIKNTSGKYSPRLPTSELYGLIGRNTPLRVTVEGFDVTHDTFNRIVAEGWGTCEYNGAGWVATGSGGSVGASDTHIDDPLTAVHSVPATSAFRFNYLDEDSPADTTLTVRLRALDTAGGSDITGGDIEGGLILRLQDVSNYYHARVEFNADQTITASLHRIGGAGNIGSATPAAGITYAGQWLVVKFQCTGTTIRMKVWEDGDAEPVGWDVSVTDSSISAAGGIGVRSGVASGNTNTGRHVYYRNLTIDHDRRFTGEVESWPQRWNVKGSDVWSPIQAFGIMRRLGAAGVKAPARSALHRAMLVGVLSSGLLAYWPLEDGKDTTQASSGVDGVGTLALTSAVTAGAAGEPPAGSLPYAVLDNSAEAFGPVVLPSSTAGFFSLSGLLKGTMPLPTSARAVIYWCGTVTFGGGDITQVKLVAYARWTGTAFDMTNTGLDVIVTDSGGGTSGSFGSVLGGVDVNLFDGHHHDIHVRLDQSGSDVVGELWVDGEMADTATSSSKTLGVPSQVFPLTAAAGTLGGTTVDNNDTSMGFGHYGIHAGAASGVTATDVHDVTTGHAGETAADRIDRLAGEEGIACTILGDPALSEAVGVQRVAPLLELLTDASDADGGLLYEPRGFLGLAYRTHWSLYNQDPVIELDYADGGEVAPPLTPVEDTAHVGNDITVTRYLGGSSRAVKETGTLNVSEPTDDPQGVGRIPKEHTLVLYTDDQTVQQAYWRRHLGTWDDARFPVVNMDCTAMSVDGKTALIGQAASLDMGDRLVITNPPAWLTYDDIEQHAQGFVELIESHRRVITVAATPARPYNVGILDDTTWGRLDNDSCTLNEALDTTETGVDVISVRTPWGSEFNYDINIGGERMTVTARSGAGLTQTLTVTRSVNGVVKSHASGAEVRLWNPLRLAR